MKSTVPSFLLPQTYLDKTYTSLAQEALGRELDHLQFRVSSFRDNNFPKQTPLSAARKIRDESEELVRQEELLANSVGEGSDYEAADVLITLLGWCEAVGVKIVDVVLDAHLKMDVNEARKWTVNPDGTAQHVQESE